MRPQPNQIDELALLRTEHHPATRTSVDHAIDSTATGAQPSEQTFADKALPLAEVGTPAAPAALILGMSVEVFQEKVRES